MANGQPATQPISVRGGLFASRLARRAARGERAAFEQIYRDFHQELYRYCYTILRDPTDAEDALQATMAAALRALPGEKREVSLRPWLYRVAHNEAISLLRGRRVTVELENADLPGSQSAAAEQEGRERLRALLADLANLPERQRGAIVMRELSGLGYPEIGLALECSEGAARQTVYEARMALRSAREGREMTCDDVRHALSDGDRRRMRGRRVRAHLDSCRSCADFRGGILERERDLRALCPALPLAAASTMLAGLLGASSTAVTGGVLAGAGAAGGGSFAGIAGSSAVKGASLAAAVVLAAGAGDIGGVIELPGPLHLRGGAANHSSAGAATTPAATDSVDVPPVAVPETGSTFSGSSQPAPGAPREGGPVPGAGDPGREEKAAPATEGGKGKDGHGPGGGDGTRDPHPTGAPAGGPYPDPDGDEDEEGDDDSGDDSDSDEDSDSDDHSGDDSDDDSDSDEGDDGHEPKPEKAAKPPKPEKPPKPPKPEKAADDDEGDSDDD